MVGDILDIFGENNQQLAQWRDLPPVDDAVQEQPPLSLVIACDVFCYIGDLQPIFDQVHRALESGGLFAFSNELLLENSNNKQPKDCQAKKMRYQLHNCARFAHSQSYIEELARGGESMVGAVFENVGMKQAVLRKNQGKDVVGLLTVLRKQ